jgi:hypothetical protein
LKFRDAPKKTTYTKVKEKRTIKFQDAKLKILDAAAWATYVGWRSIIE